MKTPATVTKTSSPVNKLTLNKRLVKSCKSIMGCETRFSMMMKRMQTTYPMMKTLMILVMIQMIMIQKRKMMMMKKVMKHLNLKRLCKNPIKMQSPLHKMMTKTLDQRSMVAQMIKKKRNLLLQEWKRNKNKRVKLTQKLL